MNKKSLVFLLGVVVIFVLGFYAGFLLGDRRQQYLTAREDLILRLVALNKLDRGDLESVHKTSDMEILGDCLVLHNSPSWFTHFKHGPLRLAPNIIERRKSDIKMRLGQINGSFLSDEGLSNLVEIHLSKPELFITNQTNQ